MSSDQKKFTVYVASRATEANAGFWRSLRGSGAPIISSWIDEAGEGKTESFSELWSRIHREIAECSGLLFYGPFSDAPWKGAFVEVGIAIALGKQVVAVIRGETEGRTYRPVGSWVEHPQVSIASTVADGFDLLERRVDQDERQRDALIQQQRKKRWAVEFDGVSCATIRSAEGRLYRLQQFEEDVTGNNWIRPTDSMIPPEDAIVAAMNNVPLAVPDGPWKKSVVDALIVGHIFNDEHERNPAKAISDLLTWEAQMALDPQVSKPAAELIQRGRNEYRDEVMGDRSDRPIGASIRCRKCGAATEIAFAYGKLSELGDPIWFRSESAQEISDYYKAIIPRLRIVAKSFGYALAVHGSMLRDLDLVAIPWQGPAVPPDTLAANLQLAACGISNKEYHFEKKPHGRVATSFAIGQKATIDLSVLPQERASTIVTQVAQGERNWTEDFSQENGQYLNTCCSCGHSFMGNKHRVVCKLCKSASEQPDNAQTL